MSKYPRTYHFNFSKGVTNDDRIAESISNLIGKEIVITEKLDGSNTAMTSGGVYGRSHAEFTRNPWDVKSWEIYNTIKKDIHDGLFLFGEGMYGIHSITYNNLKSYFYLFGVRDNNIWVSWDKVEEYSYLLDIPTVPVLFKGILNTEDELKNMIINLSNEPSSLGGIREGVVARNYSLFHNDDFESNVIKFVRKDHVQTSTHWTRNWKKSKLN